jgi:hypothetical protein
MLLISRRAGVAATPAALALVLAGCSSTGATSAASIIADLQAGFTALQTQLPALAKADPGLAAAITPYVGQATGLLASLTAASPTMTGTLATIDGIINAILSAASGIVPPPYDLLVEGLAVLAPELEAVINPLLSAPATAAARMPFPHPHVADLAQARALFAVYR